MGTGPFTCLTPDLQDCKVGVVFRAKDRLCVTWRCMSPHSGRFGKELSLFAWGLPAGRYGVRPRAACRRLGGVDIRLFRGCLCPVDERASSSDAIKGLLELRETFDFDPRPRTGAQKRARSRHRAEQEGENPARKPRAPTTVRSPTFRRWPKAIHLNANQSAVTPTSNRIQGVSSYPLGM